jgi:hypothetical protein
MRVILTVILLASLAAMIVCAKLMDNPARTPDSAVVRTANTLKFVFFAIIILATVAAVVMLF